MMGLKPIKPASKPYHPLMTATVSSELNRFVGDVVHVPTERLSVLQDTAKDMCSRLHSAVGEHGTYGLTGFVPSGSVAKKTAIRGGSDLDIAAYLRLPPDPGTSHADVLHYLRDRLREVYPEKVHEITEGNHAVRVRFLKARVDVDVVPIISDGEPGGPGMLWDRDAGDWIETDIGAHVGAIDRLKQNHPRYCELVRLTKWWRKSQPDLRFRSFIIEILWGFLLERKVVDESDLGEAMLGFFAYVARTGLREPIVLAPGASPIPRSDPIFVSDPAIPTRNAARNVTGERRDAFVQACREALEQLAIAETAADRATASRAYRALFGPEFPQVSPRELDQCGAPAGDGRRAAARLRAELRQLRLLSDAFSSEAEATRADALRLWMESGFVESIEFAFCEPGTVHRRFSTVYRPADAGAEVAAGLDVPDLTGSSFKVHVTGNSTWSAMDDAERQAFYRRLPGNWGPAEQLYGGAATGATNIGGGEPGVVRTVMREHR